MAKKWIWQHEDYPNFNYTLSDTANKLLQEISYFAGLLKGTSSHFTILDLKNLEIETLLDEVVSTMLIEGETIKRDSVRASLAKKLKGSLSSEGDCATHQSDNLAEILLDCSLNKDTLFVDRLHGWHNALFEAGYSGLNKIKVACFREEDDMKVVSGSIGNEKTHYQAPPVELLNKDIDRFLDFCNIEEDKLNIYIKSAIAQLWFLIIHPYDDGNGRIARAISDYLLSSICEENQFKLYSISGAIHRNKKEYYKILDQTTNILINKKMDITPWLEWNLKIIKESILYTLDQIQCIKEKTNYWDRCRKLPLNERQLKVLDKLWSIGPGNFEGGLSRKKYCAMTKTSPATAKRDITQLLEFDCIKQIEGTKGRNIAYELKIKL